MQVGDITDKGANVALDTRATCAQTLYNAGIGFTPLRGNHESKQAAAAEFTRVFPQTQNGSNNSTPSDAFVTTSDDEAIKPAPRTGSSFALGADFGSPSENLKDLSYSSIMSWLSGKSVRYNLHRNSTPSATISLRLMAPM